ncbi:hypothetical protein K32_24050 [Kaistia sp. 32K]|uniref:DUF2190 family protein n=1 Tax=Kaistia sp. 32K TaxID=2795690 RepID=UPI0019152FEB|nr:DUF2190 family protein [Kaistia sp. 32K]BCP53788.1 hypothetical protein K32_24050 [Kaistia sp. 32K]
MNNYIQSGDVLTVPAPYAVNSGDFVIVGRLYGVAAYAAAQGLPVEIQTRGVYQLFKAASQAWAVGDKIYWDSTNKVATNVGSGNVAIGEAVLAVDNGALSIVGTVFVHRGEQGSRVVGGQLTTVTAADTVATGLAKVISVVAILESDPTDNPEWVTAQVGDQSAAPIAGSIILKTWQNTGGTDPTPVAATTFGKKVNWIAYGY